MTPADAEENIAQGLNLRSSKDRAVLKVRHAQAELNQLLDAYMRERGAAWEDVGLGRYRITTLLGEIVITPDPAYLAEGMLTIFTRFEDPKRAATRFNRGKWPCEVNPYSGKWNFHYDATTAPDAAFQDFKANLGLILKG